ncbi:AAA family ATPase [Persephonella sp.]|uniref:AAA family ATPase n=1 Tax=Persephonella sp. TaxID=2060922 RepID=UPI0025FA4302|nr:AAA family ATPase [Persephonella sp.]
MESYIQFFALKDNPFRITPDVDFFFMSSVHQEALGSLEFLLESEEGFAVIIGEPGTGKTITIRKFISQLPDNVEYAYILFPNLSPEEMFRAILEDFGIDIDDTATKNKLFSALREFLIKKKKEGKKIFIIIDEAQNLPVDTLEELRILSNLETDKEKLIQIILLGQPELENKLNSDALRQLKQRITVMSRLNNLTENELIDYINYRLAKAGNSTIRITNSAYKEIFKYTHGNLRQINQIMERALMAAFVKNKHGIDKEDIIEATISLGMSKKGDRKSVYFVLVLTAVLTVSILSAYYFLKKPSEPVKKIEKKSALEKVYVIPNRLNVRLNPDKNSEIVYVLKKGDSLEVLKKEGNWYKIRYKNITGWVNKNFTGPQNE